MSLSGDAGGISVEIRESPSKASEGKKKVDDLGGGQYEFDSFFDVFTEISIDGGPFQPQTNEASRIELIPVPEPSRLLLLVSGALFLRVLVGHRERKQGRPVAE